MYLIVLYNCVEKLLSANKFGHSFFTRKKKLSKVLAIVFGDTLYLTSLKVHNFARFWPL